jgi:phosphoglycolate phosphatase
MNTMRRDKRGILFFDLDGTLADSGAGIMGAMNEVLTERGHTPLTREDLGNIIGPPLATSYQTFFVPRGLPPDGADDFIAEYRAVYIPKYLPKTPAFGGMKRVLDVLSASWHLGIVTSKPEKQAHTALESAGLGAYFRNVVGAPSDRSLPKARLLERAISDMAGLLARPIDIAGCWMVGDRHHDIDAAREVGTKSMGVLWGFGSHEELVSAGADKVVRAPVDLMMHFSE